MGYSIFDETMVDMKWPEIEKAAEQGAIVLLPTGVIEEHGPHMGLGVDTLCSVLSCRLAKRNLEDQGIKALIAPPYYWGINTATGSFPGSFTVRKDTMKALLYDILVCLRRWGFTYVFNLNWHGEEAHIMAILEAVREARVDIGIRAYSILRAFDIRRLKMTGREPYVLVQQDAFPPAPRSKYLEIHAESFETGLMAAYFPDHVDAELAKTLKSTDLTLEDLIVWANGWDEARKVTPLGYFGDPASFDSKGARAELERHTKDIASLIVRFLKGEYRPPSMGPQRA
jgi:creatinine amidohydrolase